MTTPKIASSRYLILTLWAGSLGWAIADIRAQNVSLTVDADKIVQPVDVKIYGQFFEHIYHSAHGGLWGELVWNRSFEEGLPRAGGRRGQPAPAPTAPPAGSTPFRHWMALGNATVAADTEQPFNSSQGARITTDTAGGGVMQNNFAVRQGDVNRGSVWMKGEAVGGLSVRLMEGGTVLAEQTLPAPGADWREYPLMLNPTAASANATLQLATRGKAVFSLDEVSLMPDSYRADGGFRTDLLQAVEAIKPASLRWPGGSYVGTNGGYNWKTAIGPQAKRVGKIGWDELDPSALGVDEFMALCKKTGAEPIIVIYMGPRTVTEDRSPWIQDACDFVEYCNGPATSKWGAVRAANGHPAPYQVKYWEIDNEVWNCPVDEYVKIIKTYVPAMKKVDPGIITIACGSGGYGNRFGDADVAIIEQCSDVVDYLSLHHYENQANYATGVGLMEAYVQKMGDLIEKSKNPNFKIYFSEWNFRRTIDWRTGLFAGGILNAFERNKYTTMACPALFLRHTSAPDWDNAFINFNQSAWFAAPNYVVMKLWRDHYEPNLLGVEGDAAGLNVTATKSADGKRVVLKVVNTTDQASAVKVAVKGNFAATKATMQMVAPDSLEAVNSFEQPNNVKVVDGKVERAGNAVNFTMPRWSVGVVELAN